MTQRERQILKWIEENPLISQQELADKAGIARSSVAVHISNLMKQGHIAGKGYIVRTAPYVVVVGGVNLDIGGRPHGELVAADSNPGQVRMSLGGVGRNIAHNMALMGLDVRMLTAFGDDMNAQRIAASCGELGIDISQCLTVPGVPITDAASLNAAADALLATGLRRVFISLGGDGVFAADHSGRVHVPCCPGEMVNTTGCGDAGMAAIAWAYLEGTGLEDTARAAMAAGAIAMESAETINPDMSARLLRRRAGFGEGVETP